MLLHLKKRRENRLFCFEKKCPCYSFAPGSPSPGCAGSVPPTPHSSGGHCFLAGSLCSGCSASTCCTPRRWEADQHFSIPSTIVERAVLLCYFCLLPVAVSPIPDCTLLAVCPVSVPSAYHVLTHLILQQITR